MFSLGTGILARDEDPLFFLLRFPGVVFFAVYVGVIFQGLQVSDDLGRHPRSIGKRSSRMVASR
jgi:hypothetical protein